MKCEKCGTELQEYIDNHSRGSVCPKCGWGRVTSYFTPMETDTTKYEIWICGNSDNCTDDLRVISKISNVNLLKAKHLLDMEKAKIFEGVAVEIVEKVKLLNDRNLRYKIIPDFPYIDGCVADEKNL